MVEAVPMVLQEPGERLIACSASRNSSWRHLAGLDGFRHLPERGARADALAAETAVQHRPAGTPRSPGCRRWPRPSAAPAWSCRSRPAARRRRSAWPRMASSTSIAARLRNIIAVGRKVLRRGREHREFEREAAGLADAVPSPSRPDRADGRCRASVRTRCCRCRSPGGRRTGRAG